MRIVKKYLYGGPHSLLTELGRTSAAGEDRGEEFTQYMLPVIGTGKSWYDVYKNPKDLYNWLLAAGSTVGDLTAAVGLGDAINMAVAKEKAGRLLLPSLFGSDELLHHMSYKNNQNLNKKDKKE